MSPRTRGCLQLLLVATCCASLGMGAVYFQESFDDATWAARWFPSGEEKYNGQMVSGRPAGWTNDGLKIPEPNKHYGISAQFSKPVDPAQGVVVQYEVKHAASHTCGGSYLKLVTHAEDFSPQTLHDQTPYSIMFGPDKCGPDSKVHLILRHTNPSNGSIEERHLVGASRPTPPVGSDTHVYTLRLTPPATYEVLVDGELKASGSLLDEDSSFSPPFKPPATIPDPTDTKPADWVDQAQIPDPAATKPADWDDRPKVPDSSAQKPAGWKEEEPATIPDPSAVKPAEWDDEEDGEWTPAMVPNPACKVGCGPWSPPLITNPAYKGKWTAPLIDNPAYKGPWQQRRIPNPEQWEDPHPLAHIGHIGAVAIEVWTIDSEYYFDNVVVASDDGVPAQLREAWTKRREQEDQEKQRAAAEAEAAKAKQAAADKKQQQAVTGLAKVIIDAFQRPPLKAVQPYAQPLLQQLQRTPSLAYALVFTPLVLLLSLALLPKGKKAPAQSRSAAAVPSTTQQEEEEKEDDNDDKQAEGEEHAAGVEAEAAADKPAAAGAATITRTIPNIELRPPAEDAAASNVAGAAAAAGASRRTGGGGSSDGFEMVQGGGSAAEEEEGAAEGEGDAKAATARRRTRRAA